MNNNENRTILFIGVGIIIGILISFALSPVMRYGGMMSWRTDSTLNQRWESTESIDRHFIEQMIPHHEDAIKMAELALKKAEHPEIKMLAEAIIENQTKENEEMRDWYQNWFTEAVPEAERFFGGGMMTWRGMYNGREGDIETLEKVTDFDKEFIEQMILHHQIALMMVQMIEVGTTRPEMITLAKNITEVQTREIIEMQNWYREWYQQ